MARKPDIKGDRDNWGDVLNEYLGVSLDEDGAIREDAAAALPISDATQATIDNRIARTPDGSGTSPAPGKENVIVKSDVNVIAEDIGASTIAGGGQVNYENVIGGDPSTINTSTPNAAVLGTGADYSFIAGGYDNVIAAIAGTIAGGAHHRVTGSHGTVAGGSLGEAAGQYAGVFAGTDNRAAGAHSLVAGGEENAAEASKSVVVGGSRNTASGERSMVLGGQDNVASGLDTTVIGGRVNTASGNGAFAMGVQARAYDTGMVAHASGHFATPGDAQASRMTWRTTTTDDTPKNATPTGGSTLYQMQDGSAIMFRAQVIASTPGQTDVKGWTVEGVASNPPDSNVVLVGGAPAPTVIAASAGATAWALSMSGGADSLRLTCTGEAGKTIHWVALLEFVEVVV